MWAIVRGGNYEIVCRCGRWLVRRDGETHHSEDDQHGLSTHARAVWAGSRAIGPNPVRKIKKFVITHPAHLEVYFEGNVWTAPRPVCGADLNVVMSCGTRTACSLEHAVYRGFNYIIRGSTHRVNGAGWTPYPHEMQLPETVVERCQCRTDQRTPATPQRTASQCGSEQVGVGPVPARGS